jgi:putative transposase
MTTSPLDHEETGKNPTDRGKRGTKRYLITEATGIPVGISVGATNTHDIPFYDLLLKTAFGENRSMKAEEWSDCV